MDRKKSKWPKSNFEKKVFLKMVLRLRFLTCDKYYDILAFYFLGNLCEISALTIRDHQDHQVRAELEGRQWVTVSPVCTSRGLEESWDLGISVPHTEEILQQLHPSRDVKSLALATNWPHPRHRLQENLRVYHGNMVFPDI